MPRQTENFDTSIWVKPYRSWEVPAIWGRIGDLVDRALAVDDGKYNKESVYRQLINSAYQLWVVHSPQPIAFFITSVIQADNGKELVVHWAAGERSDDWLPWFSGVERWAASIGCERVRIYGRKGWQKKMPDYRAKYVVLEKKIGEQK